MSNRITLGRYKAVAVPGTEEILEPTKDGGNHRVRVTLRVVEGDDIGKPLYWSGSLAEGMASEITVKGLRTLGWVGNDITKMTGIGSVVVDAVVTQREGSKYTDVSVYPVRAARPTLRAEDQKAFAARFKDLAKTIETVQVSDANRAPAELPALRTDSKALEFPPTDSGAL